MDLVVTLGCSLQVPCSRLLPHTHHLALTHTHLFNSHSQSYSHTHTFMVKIIIDSTLPQQFKNNFQRSIYFEFVYENIKKGGLLRTLNVASWIRNDIFKKQTNILLRPNF